METMTIILPTPLREFVEQQMASRGMTSPSDFFQELLDHERQLLKRNAQLEAALLEGLDEGPTVEFTKEWWQQQQAFTAKVSQIDPLSLHSD